MLAGLAVAGGFYLESSGLAGEGLTQALDQLPGGTGPGPDGSTDGTTSPTARPTAAVPTETPSPEASPSEDDEVVQATGPVQAPAGSALYWGVHQPGVPYDTDSLDRLESEVGAEPAIVMWYQEWAGSPPFPASAVAEVLDQGAVPMITWEAWSPPASDPSLEPGDALAEAQQPAFQLSRIADGAYDDYLRGYAQDVADFGGPVMLRPFHEMNGFWYPWGGTVNGNRPADFVDAWRHLRGIFEDAGADNVTWVWSVNHLSLPDRADNQVDAYWPGEDEVDWIGVSGFNFGDTSEVSSWRSFEGVYGDVLDRLQAYDKPIVLAEIATVPSGGDAGAWIDDAFTHIRADHPAIGGLVWFDREFQDVRDFRIAASEDGLEAFRAAVTEVGVLGSGTALRTATDQTP